MNGSLYPGWHPFPEPPEGMGIQFEAKHSPISDGWHLYTRLRTAERQVVAEDFRAVSRTGLVAAQIEAAEELINEWKAANVRSPEPSPAQ